MFEVLTLPGINRLLRANAWALERLRPHASKSALFACAPFELHVTVLDSGELAPARMETEADVTIRVSPGLMLRIAARDEAAWRDAQVSGDTELAAAIDYVRRNLEWDFEEDLSRVFGDIAAHRLANAVRELDRWGRGAALNIAHAFAEYSTYEKPLVANARAVEEFNREVDRVRDDTERLEKRIELLSQRQNREP